MKNFYKSYEPKEIIVIILLAFVIIQHIDPANAIEDLTKILSGSLVVLALWMIFRIYMREQDAVNPIDNPPSKGGDFENDEQSISSLLDQYELLLTKKTARPKSRKRKRTALKQSENVKKNLAKIISIRKKSRRKFL